MTDQNAHDSNVSVVTIDASQQNDQGTKVDETPQPAALAVTNPIRRSTAVEASSLTANRTFTYGAIAATIGVVAGLAFASMGGHVAAQTGASASANSNAAALAAMVKPQTTVPADAIAPAAELAAAPTPSDVQPRPASHRKAKKKDLDGTLRFAIEGDDELVGYDPAKGVIQTSARKTFLVSTATVAGNSSAWQDGPANIHYKCDLNASCTLTRRGAAVLYAQLKK